MEMDDEIKIIMRRDTWEIISRKSVADPNVLPGKWSFKCKRKTDWNIRKIQGTILCERVCLEETVS